MIKPAKQIFLSLPAIIIAAIIFIVSNTPNPGLPKLGIIWEDKLLHFIAYFIFGLSIILFLIVNLKSFNKNKIIILTLLLGAFYSASDEIHQYYIPGRYSDITDWIADMAGILLSITLINKLKNNIFKPNDEIF